MQLCARRTWRDSPRSSSLFLPIFLPLFFSSSSSFFFLRGQRALTANAARAFHPPWVATKLLRRLAKRLAVILPEANDQVSRSRATQVDLVSADILETHHPETGGACTRRVESNEREEKKRSASDRAWNGRRGEGGRDK